MARKKTVNFGSKSGYQRWLAYGHIHGVFNGPGENITIRGKKHKIHHEKK